MRAEQPRSVSMELETWIQRMSSSAEPITERVAMASEIADVTVRYIEALDAGEADTARAELTVLRELCAERMAALRALPRRKEPD
jgi:hypothetical protein